MMGTKTRKNTRFSLPRGIFMHNLSVTSVVILARKYTFEKRLRAT